MRLRRSGAPTKKDNPFLPSTVAEEASGVDEADRVGAGALQGPPAPGGAPCLDEPVLVLPEDVRSRLASPAGVLVQVVGLHGGAGTSTIAALLEGAGHDCGVGLDALIAVDVPLILVARTHARGLELARQAGQQWSSGGLAPLDLLGMVLVADAPERSSDLERGAKRVRRGVPNGWLLEWSEAFRHDPDLPDLDSGIPGSARRVRNHILQTSHGRPRAAGETTSGRGAAGAERRADVLGPAEPQEQGVKA